MISSFARRAFRRMADLAKRRSGVLLLIAALAVIGAGYAAFTPSSSAAPGDQNSVAARKGQELFNDSCISCHGRNLQGVPGRGDRKSTRLNSSHHTTSRMPSSA